MAHVRPTISLIAGPLQCGASGRGYRGSRPLKGLLRRDCPGRAELVLEPTGASRPTTALVRINQTARSAYPGAGQPLDTAPMPLMVTSFLVPVARSWARIACSLLS